MPKRITPTRNTPPTTTEVLSTPFATSLRRGLLLRRLSLLLFGVQRWYTATTMTANNTQGMVGSVIVSSSDGAGAQEQGGGTTVPLPASGGAGGISPSLLLPAAALLLGSGIVGYALVRRSLS